MQYNRPRSTRYYAIAGIDYPNFFNKNDHPLNMPPNFTEAHEILAFLIQNNVYDLMSEDPRPPLRTIGDNLVGFFSQIGWVGDNIAFLTPAPRIQMEKIFVDVDTNGGNGVLGGAESILHSKIPHRECVCNKVIEYLEE